MEKIWSMDRCPVPDWTMVKISGTCKKDCKDYDKCPKKEATCEICGETEGVFGMREPHPPHILHFFCDNCNRKYYTSKTDILSLKEDRLYAMVKVGICLRCEHSFYSEELEERTFDPLYCTENICNKYRELYLRKS